jgi:hypothetical protein
MSLSRAGNSCDVAPSRFERVKRDGYFTIDASWIVPALCRAVIVRMRRRAPDEKVEPFRHRVHAPLGEALRRRLAAWAEAVLHEATEARPEMPTGVEDRDADIWESLLAVADLATGEWPERARLAAVALVKAAREIEPSLNIRLLADLRTIFESREHKGGGHLSTKTVLADLCSLENAPWNDLKGKPITDNQLARRLRQYGVKPRTLRFEHNVIAKGYAREDLHDVWRRYLPPLSDESVTAVTDVTTQPFQETDRTDEALRASNEALQPLQNAGDATPVTGSVTTCNASAIPGNPHKMGVVMDVTPVTPSPGNGGGPGLRRWPVEVGATREDGAFKPPNPPRRRTRI